MAARKSADQPDEGQTQGLRVVSAFAYARALSGEVVQLVKGDLVDPELFVKESVDHLVSIGFVS